MDLTRYKQIFKNVDITIEAFVLYFYDKEKLVSKLVEIEDLTSIVTFKDSEEKIKLDEPAFYLRDKPVFIVVRGNPLSIKLELLEESFVEKGYSSDEINAKIESIYTNEIFKRKFVSTEWIVAWILSIFLSIAATLLITLLSTGGAVLPGNATTTGGI